MPAVRLPRSVTWVRLFSPKHIFFICFLTMACFFVQPAWAQVVTVMPPVDCTNGSSNPANWVEHGGETVSFQYVCTMTNTITSDNNGNIEFQDVLIQDPIVDQSGMTTYALKFLPNDQVTITSDGCVNRGGANPPTWARYVNPNSVPYFYSNSTSQWFLWLQPPPSSEALYFGTLWIPYTTYQNGSALAVPATASTYPGGTPLYNLVLPQGVNGTVFNVLNVEPPAALGDALNQFGQPLQLQLGYTDNGYGDNGYYNQDNGNTLNTDPGECYYNAGNGFTQPAYDSSGNPAWINVHIVHGAGGKGSAIPAPFDVVSNQFDINSFPLNPVWGWQLGSDSGDTPGVFLSNNTWPPALSNGPVPSTFMPYSTQNPTTDLYQGNNIASAPAIWGSEGMCSWSFGDENQLQTGHINFTTVTYMGTLIGKGLDHAGAPFFDDDLVFTADATGDENQYSPPVVNPPLSTSLGHFDTDNTFEVFTTTNGTTTSSIVDVDEGQTFHAEMNQGETLGFLLLPQQNGILPNFPWWSKLMSLTTQSRNDYGSTGQMITGRRAIINGLLGLDADHQPSIGEIHPIFNLAIEETSFEDQTDEPQPSDVFVDNGNFFTDTWAILGRAEGNEGSCSSHNHYLGQGPVTYTVELPPPNASAQFINQTTHSLQPGVQASLISNDLQAVMFSGGTPPALNLQFFPGDTTTSGAFLSYTVPAGGTGEVLGEVTIQWTSDGSCPSVPCTPGKKAYPVSTQDYDSPDGEDDEEMPLVSAAWNAMSASQQALAVQMFHQLVPPPPMPTFSPLTATILTSAPTRPVAPPADSAVVNPNANSRMAAGLHSYCAATGTNTTATTLFPAGGCTGVPPVTLLSVSNSPLPGGAAAAPDASGWYTAPIYVLPTAYSGSGSPIAYTAMTVIPTETEGSSQSYTYTTPATAGVQLAVNSNNITYASADTAGNTEGVNSQTVKVAPEVSFIGTDSTTQGNWIQSGLYGMDGSIIVNSYFAPPSYVAPVTTGTASYTWNPAPTDVRALETNINGSRIASTWYTYGSMSVDFPVTDNRHHKLSVYCVDWDSSTRNETLQIVDTATNTVLDTRTISNFNGGIWLSWTISGNVTLRVQNNSSTNNAVLSGLFFASFTEGTPPTITTATPFAGAVYAAPPGWADMQLVPSFSTSSPVGLSTPPTMFIDGTQVYNGVSTQWLGLGSHTFSVVATDNWGNQSTYGGGFTINFTNSTTGGGGHLICPTCNM